MDTRSLVVVVTCFALGMVLQALIMLRGTLRPGDAAKAALAAGLSMVGLLPSCDEFQHPPAERWFLVCLTAAFLFAAFFRARLLPRIGGRILLAWNILLVYVVLHAGWTSPFLLVSLGIVSALTVVNAFSDIDRGFGWKVFFHAWFTTILVVLAIRGMDASSLAEFFAGDPAITKRSPLELVLAGAAVLYVATNAFFVLALVPLPIRRGQPWKERLEEIRRHMELLARGYVWEKDDPVRSLAVLVVLPLLLLAIARWGVGNDPLVVSAAIAMLPGLAGRVPDAPEEPPRPGPRFARPRRQKRRRA